MLALLLCHACLSLAPNVSSSAGKQCCWLSQHIYQAKARKSVDAWQLLSYRDGTMSSKELQLVISVDLQICVLDHSSQT